MGLYDRRIAPCSNKRLGFGVLLSLLLSPGTISIFDFLFPKDDSPSYRSYRKTNNIGGSVEQIFYPTNTETDVATQSVDFQGGLDALRAIVSKAQADGKRLRAFGSRWCTNNAPYQKEYQIDSTGLNFIKVGFEDDALIDAGYQLKKDKLAFVQAGIRVREVSEELAKKGLALSTSGIGDGQRLVGAVSTGTHGSAIQYGAMQEYVRGIHLVLPSEEVFIQRSSKKAVAAAFAQDWLDGARLIEDDGMFNAAVVSFGSFGIVHGLLIEVEPNYTLEVQTGKLSWDVVKSAIPTFNMNALGFTDYEDDEIPFDVTIGINPYQTSKVNVRTIRKTADSPDYDPQSAVRSLTVSSGGDEWRAYRLASPLFALGAWVERLVLRYPVGFIVNKDLPVTKEAGVDSVASPREIFTSDDADNDTSFFPEVTIEWGVPLERVQDAMDILLEIFHDNPIPGGLGIRFVKSDDSSTLAFTKYSPVTAAIQVTAVWGNAIFRKTGDRLQRAFEAMSSSGIPHTFHWGKRQPMGSQWVLESYGSEAVEAWKTQRARLLDVKARRMFSNQWLEDLGLHDSKLAF